MKTLIFKFMGHYISWHVMVAGVYRVSLCNLAAKKTTGSIW